MALIPIWFGSKRALAARIKRIKDKEEGKTGDDLGMCYIYLVRTLIFKLRF